MERACGEYCSLPLFSRLVGRKTTATCSLTKCLPEQSHLPLLDSLSSEIMSSSNDSVLSGQVEPDYLFASDRIPPSGLHLRQLCYYRRTTCLGVQFIRCILVTDSHCSLECTPTRHHSPLECPLSATTRTTSPRFSLASGTYCTSRATLSPTSGTSRTSYLVHSPISAHPSRHFLRCNTFRFSGVLYTIINFIFTFCISPIFCILYSEYFL